MVAAAATTQQDQEGLLFNISMRVATRWKTVDTTYTLTYFLIRV